MVSSRSSSLSADATGADRSRRYGSLRFLMPYMKPYISTMLVALVAMGFTAAALLGVGHGLRYLVDEGLGKGDPYLLDHAFWFLAVLTVLLAIASFLRSYGMAWVGEQVVADIRRDAFAHAMRLSPGYYADVRTGEVLSRLTTDTTLLQAVVTSTLAFALRNLLMLMGGAGMLLWTSPTLAAYMLLLIPAVVMPVVVLGRKVRMYSRRVQDCMADLTATMEEGLSHLQTVQAYGLEESLQQRNRGQLDAMMQQVERRLVLRSLLVGLVIALVFGAIVLLLWMGGHRVLTGEMSAGELSSFVFYAVLVAAATGGLSEVSGDLQRAAGAAERLMELLATQPVIQVPMQPKALPAAGDGTGVGRLECRHVRFAYPGREGKPAIQALNLVLQPGEKVALVGPSGAGKTTLLQLLLRFYDPQGGEILLDGVSLREMHPDTLRNAIAYVPQEPAIFAASAWENIRYGRPEATDAEVIEAARAAEALDFLNTLPDGLDSLLGERGNKLSGGQRQRIAIARALLRKPRLVLLDEATSALDAHHEQKVQQAMENLMQGRTTLVIAHRLATIRHMDRIVVLRDGQIVEEGTHQSLLKRQGLYAGLAALQFGERQT